MIIPRPLFRYQIMVISLTAAHQQFIVDLQHQHKTTNTILAYGKDIAQFLAFLSQNSISTPDHITPDTIDQFQASLPQAYTAKSVSRKLNSLKTFRRFLHQNGITAANPSTHVHNPPVTPHPPRILSPLEYRALRDAARTDTRLAAIVELLLQTGLRIGEVSHLKLDDITPDHRSLTITPYESRLGRTVPLSPSARQALVRYLENRPHSSDPTLFVTKTGRPFLIRNIRASINRLFRQAGIKSATVNDLRHTFIATQIRAGIPLNFIAEVVGHKRLSTTEIYLKYVKPGTPNKQTPAPQLAEL